MKKAELFEKLYLEESDENKNVKCNACAQGCILSSGKVGLCGVRKNIKGELFSLIYGKLIAQHIDPIEKKPLFNFLPGTWVYSIGTMGCNFKCGWCQNYDISQILDEKQIIGKNTKPEEVVEEALNNKCKSIAYTYNEPIINVEFIRDTARIAKKKGLQNILVTNGYLTKESFEFLQKENLIDAMNIDLKSFKDETYKKFCNAIKGIKPVLKTINRAYKSGIHIEIATLVIPDLNDSNEELKEIAEFIYSLDRKGEIPWHISRFFPMYKMQDREPTEISVLEKTKKMGKDVGLNYVYLGNV